MRCWSLEDAQPGTTPSTRHDGFDTADTQQANAAPSPAPTTPTLLVAARAPASKDLLMGPIVNLLVEHSGRSGRTPACQARVIAAPVASSRG